MYCLLCRILYVARLLLLKTASKPGRRGEKGPGHISSHIIGIGGYRRVACRDGQQVPVQHIVNTG